MYLPVDGAKEKVEECLLRKLFASILESKSSKLRALSSSPSVLVDLKLYFLPVCSSIESSSSATVQVVTFQILYLNEYNTYYIRYL